MLFLPLLWSCSKNESETAGNDLKFVSSTLGGCAVESNNNLKAKELGVDIDTVIYTIKDGNLELMVGFNATCCGAYSTCTSFMNDTLFVEVETTQIGMCDCICYYTYTLEFTGVFNSCFYKVTVDDYLTFTGEIEL